MDEKQPSKTSRLVELDALRGLAAVAVVLYHYCHRFPAKYGAQFAFLHDFWWGCYGVQVFFILSGFVIYMSLERAATSTDFAALRAIRLYPTYWAGICITVATVLTLGLPDWTLTWPQISLNFTMLQSFLAQPSVDGAYWSLAEELKFYFLMIVAKQIGLVGEPFRVCTLWLLAAAISVWGVNYLQYNPAVMLFKLIGILISAKHCFWFTTGIAFFRLSRDLKDKSALLIFLISIAYAIAFSKQVTIFPIAVSIFAIAVFARPSWLRSRSLVFLGAISYPLYVIHQNVGYCIIQHSIRVGLTPLLSILLAMMWSMLLAWLVHERIEIPAGRHLRRLYFAMIPQDEHVPQVNN